MRVSSSIATISALIGTIVPMVFIIFLGGLWLFKGEPIQVTFTYEQFLPDLSSINNSVFFAAIMFGFMGVELSSVHADSVQNPRRDYPRALLYSAVLIFSMLVLSSLSIAMVVPHKDLSLVTGFLDAYSILLNTYNLSWMTPIMAGCILIGAFGGVSAWALGPAKGLYVAISDMDSFQCLKKVNAQGTPVGILIAQAIVFSILCSVFLLMPTVSSSYWILSALSAQFALIVYILLFAAAISLRYSQPHVTRTFRLGKSNVWIWALGLSGIVTCLLTLFIGFLPPSQIEVGSVFRYEVIMVLGGVACILPLFFIWPKAKESRVFVSVEK
jgi:amino acid transporter